MNCSLVSPLPARPSARSDTWTDRRIVTLRSARNPVDPGKPYGCFVEPECTADGMIEDVATVLLTNRECPFRCLMCDLWKNTTDRRVPVGAIPAQIDYALGRLPPARHIKLYNSGNFFDAQAIPPTDHGRIAQLLAPFETVIVECHPRLVGRRCLKFQHLLRPRLQVALGLETVHPAILPRLNKRMTLDDFRRAAQFLTDHGIAVRAFILLRPPWLQEDEGLAWAERSLEFAFDVGVECCVVIPTRAGNGAMDRLQEQGQFAPPRLESLEDVLEYGIQLRRGRVFADLWDAAQLATCQLCSEPRIERMRRMNLSQQVQPHVACDCGGVS